MDKVSLKWYSHYLILLEGKFVVIKRNYYYTILYLNFFNTFTSDAYAWFRYPVSEPLMESQESRLRERRKKSLAKSLISELSGLLIFLIQ